MKRTHAQPGFSLIELLVVISIIAILMGILVPAGMKMMEQSKASQTQATLSAYAGAMDSYQLHTGSVPDHTDTTIAGLEVSDDNSVDTTTGLFLIRIYQLGEDSATWKMILSATKGAELIKDTSSSNLDDWALLDIWGNKMRYVKSVSHDDTFTKDDFLPANPTYYFASAGLDGLWGDEQERLKREDGDPYDSDLASQTDDNIYSFDMN